MIDPLLAGTLETVLPAAGIARRAAAPRAAHYHRSERPLLLAGCVVLASGAAGDRVAGAVPHVLAVARDAGLEPISPQHGS